jgi:hypothetical protein
VNSVAARRSEQALYAVYLARVIKIEAVQCHRAAATDDSIEKFLFFDAGCRPGLPGHFQLSLDTWDAFPPGPFASVITPVSVPMQRAWNAAVAAFKEFIKALANGELIAKGAYPATGVRHDLDPAEWTREGLILDVRNGNLYEMHNGKHVRWSAITLRAPVPEPQLRKRIDREDWWKHEIARRQQDSLPNKKDYLREAEALIKERYGVTAVPPSELRRIKAALYRGDPERPKRSKRKQPKLKG